MSNKEVFKCPHCKRDDFKRASGLRQHLERNQMCAPLEAASRAARKQNLSDVALETVAKVQQNQAMARVLVEDSLAVEQIRAANAGEKLDLVTEKANLQGNQCVMMDADTESLDDEFVNIFAQGFDDLEEESVASMSVDFPQQDHGNAASLDEESSSEEHIEPVERFREYCDHAQRHFMPFTKDQVEAIRLMRILWKKRATLDTYDAVMEWHFRAVGELKDHHTLGDSYHFISRRRLIKFLAKRYNWHPNMYEIKSLVLPFSKTKVDIVFHDAREMMVSLLTDPRITDKDKLHFDEDPFAVIPKNLSYVADLNTADNYIATYHKLITDPERQMLVPIVLYIDGAVTGQHMNLKIEALRMTLGIFNQTTRDIDHAWRALGYVPNYLQEKSRGKKMLMDTEHAAAIKYHVEEDEGDDANGEGIETKAQDWHSILDSIMETLRDLIENGMRWDYKYGGKVHKDVELIFYIAYIKCDNEEADKLCGKYLCRNGNVAQLCRYCCCPTARTDDHEAKFKFKTEPMIRRLVDKKDLDRLKKLSQQYINNAFYGMRFGLHNDRGIHGACPVELLHTLLLGIFMYVKDAFFEQIGPTSDLAKKDISGLASMFGEAFTRQSERDLPKTKFSKGIQAGKLEAKEIEGVMLLIAAILQSQKGRDLLKSKRKPNCFATDELLDDWALLVETLIEWQAYLKLDRMERKHLVRLEKKHRHIFYLLKRIGNRTEGMGMKLLKFHALIHLAQDILMFGVCMGVDTGSNESMHKLTKVCAKLTQKDARVFEPQTAERIAESFLLDLADCELNGRCLWDYYVGYDNPLEGDPGVHDSDLSDDAMEEADVAEDPPAQPREKSKTYGTKIEVYWQDETESVEWRFRGSKMKNAAEVFWDTQVTEYLFEIQVACSQYLPTLPIRTEHKREDLIFRGHPNYRQMGMWNDWAIFDWNNHGKLPGEIWCFVDLRSLPQGARVKFRGNFLSQGVYAVVESAYYFTKDLGEDKAKALGMDLAEADRSDIFRPIIKECVQDENAVVVGRKFELPNVEAIVAPLCVVPDIGSWQKCKYFQVLSRKQWSKEFITWIEQQHAEDKEQRDE